jgi:antitoxin FitA
MQQLETEMATLTIRNMDAAVKARLRVRAARHGRSMEAEARTILSEAVAAEPDESEPNLAEAIRRRFAPLGGVDLELPPRELVARSWECSSPSRLHREGCRHRSIANGSSHSVLY